METRSKGNTKSLGRKQAEDKFYTLPSIASQCMGSLDVSHYEVRIEPSAGSGSFSSLIDCMAFDLKPEHDGITQKDWFDYKQERIPGRTLVFGNPPFGQQNSLAVRFINHAASFADTVSFVLPMSFRKESVQKRIHRNLFLRHETILPRNSFTLNGKPYHVPCVFQIWDYNPDELRPLPAKTEPIGFSFTDREGGPHLAIQRVGGRAGKASLDWEEKNIQSNYFIRLEDASKASHVVSCMEDTDIEGKDHGVGPRTISKGELIPILNDLFAKS